MIPIIRPNKGVLPLGLQLDTSVTLHCFFFRLGVLVAARDVITEQLILLSEAAQIMTAHMGVVGL